MSNGPDYPPGRKRYAQPSVFTPGNLLREARRQKAIPPGDVPKICVLDPDGDLSRHLRDSGARRNPYWACYHTDVYELELEVGTIGVLGCAVGAPFAVLVAEELFVSGCEFLISVTSAGQIVPARKPPYFVLIDRALRDEGTSNHYLPPARYARIPEDAMKIAQEALTTLGDVVQGGTWTTDAPFRETVDAIAFARSEHLLAVEMEAAALYALAEAKRYPILCIAHVTNVMAQLENDFEKGEQSGNAAFRRLISALAESWAHKQ
jgi:uridine phosphorylase